MNLLALMSFDGPDQILPIFHHLMSFDGPKNLVAFDGPKSRFSPFKISCLLRFIYIFKVFPSQNLMSFDGPTTRPKPHVF
jgi:hypothetical protein